MTQNRRQFISMLGATALAQPAQPDWPQWRGPRRDGLSTESGLKKEWPSGAPPRLWQTSGHGAGYGTVAISGDRIYLQGATGGRSAVNCLERSSGKPIWSVPLGPVGSNDRGSGPRSTPTVEGSRLYVLTESGDLACLETKDGSMVWQKNLIRDFKGSNIRWLLSESPLIEGDKVIVSPGADAATVVALNKNDGRWIWSSSELSDRASYASAIAFDAGGVRCISTLTSAACVGLRTSDGKLLWRYAAPMNGVANVTTPIFHNNRVFSTSAYDGGCGLIEISASGGSLSHKELWFNRDLKNHHGGVVLVDGYLYGYSNTILTCMEFATGKVMWRDRSVGKGCVKYADGRLYLVGESQTVGLAEATPEAYRERGRFTIEDQGEPSWAHPVVCAGRLYIRNQGLLTCYDVRA